MLNRISKYRVFAQLWSCHAWWDRNKSYRGGQKSLHTLGGPIGC